MIVSFSVSNFRSFSQEETISLIASNRLSGSHEDHTVPIPESAAKVLRTAVLYGANGAGKSNLFKALRYLQRVVTRPSGRSGGTGRKPFRLDGSHGEPSGFDLQFITAGRLYRFGLTIDDERVTEEWLSRVHGGQETSLYERTTDDKGRVSIVLKGLKEAGKKVGALATIGGPQNQSFLATVHATLDPADIGEELGSVLNWFKTGLHLVGPGEPCSPLRHLLDRDSSFRSFAGTFLKSAGTGVDHLETSRLEISNEEIRRLLPDALLSKLLRDLGDGEDAVAVVSLPNGKELTIERKGGGRFYRVDVQAAHRSEAGRVVPLELDEESDGTCRLLNLMPALRTQGGGSVYFIDEIDRSLHPMLVKEFLKFFLKSRDEGHHQIIVTTHESHLLDQSLLRRDEIWFAEKDQTAATRLYSLLDFKVRNDLEIRKHYLQGRFGAVPFLGNLEDLLPETGESK